MPQCKFIAQEEPLDIQNSVQNRQNGYPSPTWGSSGWVGFADELIFKRDRILLSQPAFPGRTRFMVRAREAYFQNLFSLLGRG